MTLDRPPSLVHPAVPPTWMVKESWTLLHPDGRGNVIVSVEPLAPEIDLTAYLERQGMLLRTEFQQFVELLLTEIMTPQGPAPLRVFEWSPPNGVPVRQHQLYWVEQGIFGSDADDGTTLMGRGYCATATSPASTAGLLDAEFFAILSSTRLGRLPS